jgi:L-ascorbate metabolism protein UlaG (beta-lactamase superfamily)
MFFKTPLYQARYHDGPITENFDGRRFSHPQGPGDKSLWEVARWRMTSRPEKWPDWVDVTPSVPDRRVDDMTLTFINQASFLIQANKVNIITDPIFSMRCSPVTWAGPKRVHAPGVAFDDLPPIDVILISHTHYDHLDIESLRKLVSRDDPIILAGLGTNHIIHRHVPAARVKTINWGDDESVMGLTFSYRPMIHWGQRTWFDRNYALWGAFVMTDEKGQSVYFAGDTGYGDGSVFRDIYREFGAMDLALLPIGAYAPRWFMAPAHINPAEAVQIKDDLAAKTTIAHHWGAFQLTDEARLDPIKALRKVRGDRDFRILNPGEKFIITE